jgi:protein SCO1
MKMKFVPTIKNTCLAFVTAMFVMACGPRPRALVLPVYGEKKLTGKDTLYHTIGPFALKNQFGDAVTSATVKDKIYVADFFFTTCQSICPQMSTNMKDVQAAFAADDSVLILSHSVNPMHDTVEVLSRYAGVYGAIKNKWHLLTGDKQAIYDLAREGYLVNAIEDDGSKEGFLHTELFLLIDGKGRIRGMYDGTDKAQVSKLIEDIRKLKGEG